MAKFDYPSVSIQYETTGLDTLLGTGALSLHQVKIYTKRCCIFWRIGLENGRDYGTYSTGSTSSLIPLTLVFNLRSFKQTSVAKSCGWLMVRSYHLLAIQPFNRLTPFRIELIAEGALCSKVTEDESHRRCKG